VVETAFRRRLREIYRLNEDSLARGFDMSCRADEKPACIYVELEEISARLAASSDCSRAEGRGE
jgi:hypothetical protein